MPLIAPVLVAPPPPPAPFPIPGGPPPVAVGRVTAVWFGPDGSQWDLTADGAAGGIVTLSGVAGLDSVSTAVTERALATGGTVARWSHAEPRLIAWPVLAQAADQGAFRGMWASFVRAFKSTTPPAGVPAPGWLRIVDSDGSWRQVAAYYTGGLGGLDDGPYGVTAQAAVIGLSCPDPWFYGDTMKALSFGYATPRSYLAPYETVSPSTLLGAQTIFVAGDVPAAPVWALTGPASSFTLTATTGSLTYNAALAAGDSRTIDVQAGTVVDQAGNNRAGDLNWPDAELFFLPAGTTSVTIGIAGAGPGAGVDLAYSARYEGSRG